jgi:hypothetical protein
MDSRQESRPQSTPENDWPNFQSARLIWKMPLAP